MDANEFLKLFIDSVENVPGGYYSTEYFYPDFYEKVVVREDHPKRQALEKYLIRYGERVFCYELYHQVRLLMEEVNPKYAHMDNEEGVYFQAELRKSQIQAVIDCFPEEVQPLDKEYVPDFLLHSPCNFENQEVVIEVKTNPEVSFHDIGEDLSKLNEFIQNYAYKIGIFLSVNISPVKLINILNANIENIHQNILSNDKLLIMIKENHESKLHKFSISELRS